MTERPENDHNLDDLDIFSQDGDATIIPRDEARVEDLDVFATGGEVPLPDHEIARPTLTPPSSLPTMPVDLGSGISAPTVGVGESAEWIESVPPELLEHPRYQVVRLLGTGGMGAVYQAEHRLMGRPVALKVIRPELLASHTAAQRFEREVRTAANLHHANIVAAYDAEQAGDLHFLAMEFVEGISLGELVRRGGPLPPADACNYIRQAALGLQYASEKGMVHRDIKPDNLMRTPAGQVKILDFGIARFAHRQAEEADNQAPQPVEGGAITLAGSIVGTPDYMAPEQGTDSTTVDIRADIYSLGCTLYYLLTGQVPFPTGTVIQKIMAHIEETPKPVRELRPEVSPGLAAVVEKMMARNPADRYQTPGEVAAALETFTTASPPAEPDLPRRIPWLLTALIGVLLVPFLLGVIGLCSGGSFGFGAQEMLIVTVIGGVSVAVWLWLWKRQA